MTAIPIDPDAYVVSVQPSIQAGLRQAMHREMSFLDQTGPEAEIPDADRLTDLLQRSVDWEVMFDDEGFVEFVQSAVEAIAREGVGEDFGRSSELLDAVDAAAKALDDLGRPTTDLHLAKATYLSTMSEGSLDRRHAIEAAVASAQNLDEYLRARIYLARFYIITSDYPQALSVADECEQLARASLPEDTTIVVEVLEAKAVANFYTDHREAVPLFRGVLEQVEDLPSEPRLDKVVAEAHHYLGRVHALHGEYTIALAEIVEGQRLSGGSTVQERKSRAYFHIRLAEILLDAGTTDEAAYHLDKAGRALRDVQDSSAAEAQFDVISARLHMQRDDWRAAEVILRNAITVAQRDNHVRGVLVSMAQLARVYLAGRRYGRSIATAMRLLRLWWSAEFNTEQTDQSPTPRRQSAQIALRTGWRMIRRPKRGPGNTVHCPCGVSHHEP